MLSTTEGPDSADRTTRVLKTDDDYRRALEEAEILIASDPSPGTAMAHRLELLALLLEDYEARQFPFDVPDPVDAIVFRMEEQGLLQRDLVPFIGSRSRVSEILNRKRPLTVQMIRSLSGGLGIPLEALVSAHRSQPTKAPEQPEELDWRKVPYKEMRRRGWFDDLRARVSGSAQDVVIAFFREASASRALYRRRLRGQDLDERAYYSTLAWSARVILRTRAAEKDLGAFDRERLTKDTFRDLARLSWLDEGPRLAANFLAKLGIALVVEPRLPNSVLDGAALLTESRIPVIGLTLRIDRVDYFWFTLMHELAHVWLHLENPGETFIDRLETGEEGQQVERDANRVARDAFVPLAVWKRSQAFLNPSRESIQNLADQLHVSPAIIAGRVQFETGRYDGFRDLLGQGTVRRLFPEMKHA